MSNADVVSYWFSDSFSTGALARDPAAYAEALAAKDDLVSRLDAAKGSAADIVGAWFAEKVANGGAIARNTVAYNEVFAAKAELIARLGAPAVAPAAAASPLPVAPAPAPPVTEPASDAA